MTFLKVATVDARQAESNSLLLQQLHDDALQAIVVKDVFSPEECDKLVADLETNRHGFPKTYFPEAFRSFFYGANLNLAHPDLTEYFGSAPAFERALDALLQPYGGFKSRVLGLLSSLDGGRMYQAPFGPSQDQRYQDRRYMVTTIRGHATSGYIPPHFDNEQTRRPGFRHLMPLIKGDLFSFVVTLHRATEGGALEVYDVEAEHSANVFVNADTGAPKPDLSSRRRMTFDVDDGTMVIVRSGRYLHRLTPVVGERMRWTFCSFMAESRDGDSVFCWG